MKISEISYNDGQQSYFQYPHLALSLIKIGSKGREERRLYSKEDIIKTDQHQARAKHGINLEKLPSR